MKRSIFTDTLPNLELLGGEFGVQLFGGVHTNDIGYPRIHFNLEDIQLASPRHGGTAVKLGADGVLRWRSPDRFALVVGGRAGAYLATGTNGTGADLFGSEYFDNIAITGCGLYGTCDSVPGDPNAIGFNKGGGKAEATVGFDADQKFEVEGSAGIAIDGYGDLAQTFVEVNGQQIAEAQSLKLGVRPVFALQINVPLFRTQAGQIQLFGRIQSDFGLGGVWFDSGTHFSNTNDNAATFGARIIQGKGRSGDPGQGPDEDFASATPRAPRTPRTTGTTSPVIDSIAAAESRAEAQVLPLTTGKLAAKVEKTYEQRLTGNVVVYESTSGTAPLYLGAKMFQIESSNYYGCYETTSTTTDLTGALIVGGQCHSADQARAGQVVADAR